jgi:HlyD family secretion protein
LNEHSPHRDFQLPPAVEQLLARLGLSPNELLALGPAALASVAVALAVVLFVVVSLLGSGSRAYRTAQVSRGPLIVSVEANGTLAPREIVDVGAEVSGRIDSVAVDFNDHVRKGQVLARINTDVLAAKLEAARANLVQSKSTLAQADDTIRRDRALTPSGAVSPQQMVAALGDFDRARAGVALAAAQLNQGETALSRATIYSPIDGVVLDRKVSVGQTIMAALTTPVLFTLASDLDKMELRVGIAETAVGQVQPGDKARFTVDAYPGRTFTATLVAIHNAPQVSQGVVTYQGVLAVDNRDGLLKPGMSASATIEAADIDDTLLVANTALRYVPPRTAKLILPAHKPQPPGGLWSLVWMRAGSAFQAHEVEVGPSDGRMTAISHSDLKVGDWLIVAPR